MGLQFEMKEAVDHNLPENTIFRARLVDLKLREFSWIDSSQNKQSASKLEWVWEITSPDEYVGRRVKGECDPVLNNGTTRRDRFRPWAEAMLDRTIPFGMKLDTDDLVGLSADITVWHRTDKRDAANKFVEIDDVMTPGGGLSNLSSEPPF